MKRRFFCAVIIVILMLALGVPAFAAVSTETQEETFTPTEAFTYTDEITKAAFVVPANWVERPDLAIEEGGRVNSFFMSLEKTDSYLVFNRRDAWGEMTAFQKTLYSRSDYDKAAGIETAATELGVKSDDIEKVTYGGKEYYSVSLNKKIGKGEYEQDADITYLHRTENGFTYVFGLFNGNEKGYDDFEALLNSMTYSASNSNDLSELRIGVLLISLILTIVIYSLPIIIYRYAIRKEPLDPIRARKVTFIYGACVFAVTTVIALMIAGNNATIGGGIILWSFVNYRVLIGGKSRKRKKEKQEQSGDTESNDAS